MFEQLCAYSIVLWLCPVGPLVLIGIGIQIGRQGFRPWLTNSLVNIFGTGGAANEPNN